MISTSPRVPSVRSQRIRSVWLMLMASLIPGHAHGQVIDCRIGPGAIHGRVVDSDGNAVIGSAAVGLLDRSCGTVPDATGRFSLAGLPADSVLLVPLAAAYCIAPRWVTTSDEDELLLIALPNLTGEAEILVHGGLGRRDCKG